MADQGYQGAIAAIRCGVGGLSVNLNPSNVSVKNVIQAEGVVFRQDNWRKEGGTLLFGTITAPAADPADLRIVAMDDWHPTESVQRLVSLRGDGHLYFTSNGGTDPGAFVSTTTSGPGTRYGFFVEGGNEPSDPTVRKLFLFRSNKNVTVVKGDVTNDVAITSPSPDWSDAHPPIVGIVNGGGSGGGRLWAAGNTNNPHALYASSSVNQQDFTTPSGSVTDPQTLSIFPGVGQRIMALTNYQGFIIVFKYPRGIFIQDARDPDPINWLTQQITDTIGVAPSAYAALQLENDVLFIGSDGQFYLLSAVISAASGQNNMQVANLGMDLEIYQFLLDAYQRNLLGQVSSVYQPFWQTATFSIAGPGAQDNQNNTRLVFDLTAVGRKGGDPRFSYSYRDTACSLALRRDPQDFIDKPIYGDYKSNVILLEQESRTAWDGALYPWRVQMPFTNLGEFENLFESLGKFVQFANRNKLWDALEIEYLPFTTANVTVTVLVDGAVKQTLTVRLCDGGKPLGFTDIDTASFVIGDSLLAGGTVRARVNRFNPGAGRRISLLFENTGAGEDVALTHIYLFFRPGDTSTRTPC